MAQLDEQATRFRSDQHEGVLHLAGELEDETVELLDAALHSAVAHAEGNLVVDLSGVTFCGSAGLAGLIRAKQAAGARSVVLVGASPTLRRLLTITGVEPLFVIEDPAVETRG